MSVGPSARRPVQIVAHMADLMSWAVSLAQGEYVWKAEGGEDWDVEVARFFDKLGALDRELEARELPRDAAEKLIQGPLADALTHVGQLAMLRGISGSPVRPESYARAEIVAGRVGHDPGRARPGIRRRRQRAQVGVSACAAAWFVPTRRAVRLNLTVALREP